MRVTIAQTLQHYEKKNLPKDICAGIIIMAVSIPISMGYAQIAGLPAVYGLYGSVFPILLFALFSTSPQFIFGVDAAPAALIGGALIDLHIESSSEAALKVVPVLTLFVAVWLLAFYLMKAGKLVNYISAPVMAVLLPESARRLFSCRYRNCLAGLRALENFWSWPDISEIHLDRSMFRPL